ncbi:MAG: phosphoribosyl-AMP cyclohydrolase [Emcibacteraceae bacterium]|nr:phosphoribosyl-AMP cyclohydrolase [Emcibacteraceae bacterium]
MARSENNKPLEEVIAKLQFNDSGLIPAIAQDYVTREVLMMAWMNEDAIRETLSSGQVCYFSRSRGKLWRKGETSGQTQTLKNFRIDCDSDTILLLVDQIGVACHTGRRSCFFEEIDTNGNIKIVSDVLKSPEELYGK